MPIMSFNQGHVFLLGPIKKVCPRCACEFSMTFRTNAFTQADVDAGRVGAFALKEQCPVCGLHFKITLTPPPPRPRRRRRKRVNPELFNRAKQWLKENKHTWKKKVSYRMAIRACRG